MERNKKYLVACSGGPDSMVLLDIYKNKYDVFVCHINYHKRETAKRDELIVSKYCKDNNIPFYKYDYKETKKGNFQKNARDFRYNAFKELINKLDLDGVLVAHHLDDHLETYLMQKKRNTTVNYYGIAKHNIINGIDVYRPLLHKTKKQLVDYVLSHNIRYGIDESNLSNNYERNRVRHSIIEKMSYNEKKELLKEINVKNIILKNEIDETNRFINGNHSFKYNDFIKFKYFDRLIRSLFDNNISSKYILEIKKALLSKNNIEIKIKGKLLTKEYGRISIYVEPKPYSYKLNNIDCFKTDNFVVSLNGKSTEGAFVTSSDFPLTIRSYQKGDSIKLRYGEKKINRFFIDKKISSYDRKVWPIVFNRKGIAILVPGLGCNITHYSDKYNIYVIKLNHLGKS